MRLRAKRDPIPSPNWRPRATGRVAGMYRLEGGNTILNTSEIVRARRVATMTLRVMASPGVCVRACEYSKLDVH